MNSSLLKSRRLMLPTLLVLAIGLMIPGVASAKFGMKDTVGDTEIKLQTYGFSQFEMRGGDAFSAEGGPFFKAQRIRIGFNLFQGPYAGKLFLDFNQSFAKDEGGLYKAIKDAFVARKFSNAFFVRMGMIKTPVGMSFTVPGWNLDIVERQGLDKGLVLERDFGFMVSGRLIGQEGYEGKKQHKCNGLEMGTERQGYGFGYDVGVFNPAGRSSAVTWDKNLLGDALAYAGRIHFDQGPALHLEASYGVSQQAGGVPAAGAPETEDYKVMGFGAASELWEQGIEIKVEYLAGENIKGIDGKKQNTLSGCIGYYVQENFELVAKHYMAKHETMGGAEQEMTNTYIGFNWSPGNLSSKWRDLQRCKIVVNYVIAGGDDKDTWGGVGGLCEDGWVVQWQYKY